MKCSSFETLILILFSSLFFPGAVCFVAEGTASGSAGAGSGRGKRPPRPEGEKKKKTDEMAIH